MREIKFRAKRIDDGRWVYGQYFKTPLTDENSGTKPEDGWYFLSDGKTRHCISSEYGVVFTIDVNTLGQFTGLKEQEQEVYEGDIVDTVYDGESFIGAVVFDESELDFKATDGTEDYGNCFQYLTCCEEVKVIGNIYDNPELLG